MSPQAPQPYTPFQGGAAQTLESTHTPAVDNIPSSHRSGHREESTMSIVPTYWQSISLDELNEKAAMQTRVDRKYIVDADYAASILAELPADEAAVLEIDGQREFAYDSVYFDTPDLVSYKASAIGSRNRFKVRTRSYLDSDLSFLEVKTEGAREFTVKERIPYSIENRDMLTAEGKEYVATALEQLTDASVDDLEPVVVDAPLVDQQHILGGAVVPAKQLHVVFADANHLFGNAVVLSGNAGGEEPVPFGIREPKSVQQFQLGSQVADQVGLRTDRQVLVGL